MDGLTVDDLRPWIAANKSLPRRRPGTRWSLRCSMAATDRNRCAGWKSPSPEAASANWASRRWSIVWSNRRCCKSLSRCSIRASRRRALASARDGERHEALLRAREYVADGYDVVVDLDLEKFFDRVNHDVLMSRLARRIGDTRLRRIIRRFLPAGMMRYGVSTVRHEGTPQGGPITP